MTKNYFRAYLERFPRKPRIKAVKAAWSYFIAFNSPISRQAKLWFEQNIGKLYTEEGI